MQRDSLEQLLRSADRTAAAPRFRAAALAAAARVLGQRRRRFHRTLAGAGTGAAVLAIGLLLTLPGRTRAPGGPAIAAAEPALEHRLDELQHAAWNLQMDIARTGVHERDDARPEPAAMEFALATGIDEQIERTAFLAVYQGDRYQRELKQPQSAMAAYEQTIRLFPETRAAQVARTRLSKLENEREKAL